MRLLAISILMLTACDREAPVDKVAIAKARASWSEAGALWADRVLEALSASAADCKTVAAAQAEDCVYRHPTWVPQEVNETTGQAGGSKIGGCTGSQLEIALRKRGPFTDTAVCNDKDYWTKVTRDQAIEQTRKP
jgi:hypothetical protein